MPYDSARPVTRHPVTRSRRPLAALRRHQAGSSLIEAAFALPLLILLLMGILAYGNWFMTAHSLQQAANDAARASVAGLNATERRTLVDQSVVAARAAFPVAGAQTIAVSTGESSGYYTVTLRYTLASAPLFAAMPLPMPGNVLERTAVVRIATQ
ncbi:TadE/TadG family type IV pilus assembly protein [Sphingobium cupriresistens]|uniref:Pilus assembly protein TadE n=1 Tax=Sphingobium cupriresistens LL01 TaxID=1420583 RepID=A0A0J7Y1U5_9SPHN|nr:TadE/TadG family type IV pilus assembly protein [Sphingobium cupriresistens]KMS57789.1 pilus assembly protein TadE [Sphingobium cupriresistens LL01]